MQQMEATKISMKSRIRFRIGINVGDVIVGGDVFSVTASVAARLEALANLARLASAQQCRHVAEKLPQALGEHTVRTLHGLFTSIERNAN
jgi:class 3 adenylate cyclase